MKETFDDATALGLKNDIVIAIREEDLDWEYLECLHWVSLLLKCCWRAEICFSKVLIDYVCAYSRSRCPTRVHFIDTSCSSYEELLFYRRMHHDLIVLQAYISKKEK